MAQVNLGATIKKGGGALGAQMLIDTTAVTFSASGKGKATVEAGAHILTVFVEGPPGAKADFTLSESGQSLSSGTVTVSNGHTKAVGSGPFQTK